MPTRVATRTIYENIANSVGSGQRRVSQLQLQLADGRAVRRPSDDPVRAHMAMRYRQELRVNRQIQRGLEDAVMNLNGSESAIAQMQDVLAETAALAASGADDSLGSVGRHALAGRLNNLIKELAELGNSRLAGVHLFSGHHTATAPLVVEADESGVVTRVSLDPRGVDGEIRRQVGRDVLLTINVTAAELFGEQGELFAGLIELRDCLAANEGDGVRRIAGSLESMTESVTLSHATVGALVERVQGLADRAAQEEVVYEEARSQAEDLAAAKAITELQMQQVTLEAALASGSQILQLSLLNYLD